MSVLREKLTVKEEEACLLERKVTELSATVSSTLASYSFLEQALAAETTKYEPPADEERRNTPRLYKVTVFNPQVAAVVAGRPPS